MKAADCSASVLDINGELWASMADVTIVVENYC